MWIFCFLIFYKIILILYYFNALNEFRTARTVTPTSANTAAHIEANPKALNIKTPIFTINAKLIF